MQYFDLTVLFLNADRFENFNDTLFIITKICTFEDLGVLATSKLVVYVIIIERGPVERQPLII